MTRSGGGTSRGAPDAARYLQSAVGSNECGRCRRPSRVTPYPCSSLATLGAAAREPSAPAQTRTATLNVSINGLARCSPLESTPSLSLTAIPSLVPQVAPDLRTADYHRQSADARSTQRSGCRCWPATTCAQACERFRLDNHLDRVGRRLRPGNAESHDSAVGRLVDWFWRRERVAEPALSNCGRIQPARTRLTMTYTLSSP